MVGHVVRFFPDYARIQAAAGRGALGQVGVVRAARLNAFPSGRPPGYADFAASGGVVVDMMIHDLDTLRWYFGDVVRLYARGLGYNRTCQQVDYCPGSRALRQRRPRAYRSELGACVLPHEY